MVLLVHSLCIREEGVRGRGKFSIKTLYSVLELGILFQQVLLGTLGYYWRLAFCLGGYLGKGFDLGSFKEERMVFGKEMFPLSFRGRIHWPYPYSLCHNKGFMAFTIFLIWRVLGAFLFGHRDDFEMTWLVYEWKVESGPTCCSHMLILDNLEEKKQ